MWKYFTLDEFACKHCGGNKMMPTFIEKLDRLRSVCGFPLQVTSGYRCPVHNANVSSTGADGPHTTGRAADIAVERDRAFLLLCHATSLGFTGIGVLQKGKTRFIHLDDLPAAPGRPRPTVWSY